MAEQAPPPTTTTDKVETTTPDETVCSRIKKQMEFYFSDLNYPRDAFLKSQAAKDPEGWIDLSIIGTFERIKSLTTDLALIARLVKDSDVLSINEDGTKVRRAKPLPPVDTSSERTAYVKGFETDATLDSLTEFFTQTGVVDCVRMRRDKAKAFKGSVFVTFQSIEDTQKFIANKPKFNEKELLVESKSDYLLRKKNERLEGKRKRKHGDEQEGAEAPAAKKEIGKYDKGTIVKFAGVAPDTTLVQLKDWLSAHGRVKFVEYNKGEDQGFARYGDEATALKMVEAQTNEKKELNGGVLTLVQLQGDEEKAYWDKIFSEMAKKSGGGKRPQKRRR